MGTINYSRVQNQVQNIPSVRISNNSLLYWSVLMVSRQACGDVQFTSTFILFQETFLAVKTIFIVLLGKLPTVSMCDPQDQYQIENQFIPAPLISSISECLSRAALTQLSH